MMAHSQDLSSNYADLTASYFHMGVILKKYFQLPCDQLKKKNDSSSFCCNFKNKPQNRNLYLYKMYKIEINFMCDSF